MDTLVKIFLITIALGAMTAMFYPEQATVSVNVNEPAAAAVQPAVTQNIDGRVREIVREELAPDGAIGVAIDRSTPKSELVSSVWVESKIEENYNTITRSTSTDKTETTNRIVSLENRLTSVETNVQGASREVSSLTVKVNNTPGRGFYVMAMIGFIGGLGFLVYGSYKLASYYNDRH